MEAASLMLFLILWEGYNCQTSVAQWLAVMAKVKILEREGRILLVAADEIPECEGSVSPTSYHG